MDPADTYSCTALLGAAAKVPTAVAAAALTAPAASLGAAEQWPNNTPLHLAAATGQIDAVSALIASGAEVDATNSYGHTPLHCIWLQQTGMTEQCQF